MIPRDVSDTKSTIDLLERMLSNLLDGAIANDATYDAIGLIGKVHHAVSKCRLEIAMTLAPSTESKDDQEWVMIPDNPEDMAKINS